MHVMKTMQTDDETNLVTRVDYKVTIVQLKIKSEQTISVFKFKGAHIPTNLSSKNYFRLTRRETGNSKR